MKIYISIHSCCSGKKSMVKADVEEKETDDRSTPKDYG